MNLSNKLTIGRLIAVPVTLTVLFVHEHLPVDYKVLRLASAILADFLFIAATITDYWDGKLARKHGWVTNFGQLMDPVADKVLVLALFTALVEMRVFAAWMVAVIIFREFLITGMRMLALQQGRLLAAEGLGKVKAGWQLGTIIGVLSFLWFRDLAFFWGLDVAKWFNITWPWPLWWLSQLSMLVALWYTLFSGWRYVRDNWGLITATEM